MVLKAFSSYFFSSTSNKTCSQRKKLLSFSKSLLHRNIPSITPHIFSSSLKFSSIFLTNLVYLSYPDSSLLSQIKLQIKSKISDLTPEIALNLIETLSMTTESSDNDTAILQDINLYIHANFHKFSSQELLKIQHYYYIFDTKTPLPFNPLLTEKMGLLQLNLKLSAKESTDLFIETTGLKLPKGLSITIFNQKKQIEIRFLNTGQKLTLFGIEHMEKADISELRRAIYKQKQPILYFFERSPANYQKYRLIQENNQKNGEINRKNLFDLTGKTEKNPKELLAELKEISFLNKEFLQFYVDNFLLKNKEEYILNEAENLLYINDWNLKKPDELSSLLYIITRNKHPKSQDFLLIFSDISLIDEIQLFCEGKTTEELRKNVEFLRFIWLNEMINWLRKVNKNGCPICCKTNNFGPNDVYNALGDNDFDLSIREKEISMKILKGLAINQQYKESIGFFGSDHLMKIVGFIGKNIENEEKFFEKYQRDWSVEEANRELFGRKIDYKAILGNEEVLEEIISKWALFASAFSREK